MLRLKSLLHLLTAEREYFGALRRSDSEVPRVIAVHFQHFNFENQLAHWVFEILDQARGDRDGLRRGAHRDRAAARIQVSACDAGDFTHEAEGFRHLFGIFRSGKHYGSYNQERIVLAFLLRIFGDEKEMFRQGPPESAGLLAEYSHRGGEIKIVDVEANRARAQVYVKRDLESKLPRDFVVGALRIASEIKVLFPGRVFEMNFAGQLLPARL